MIALSIILGFVVGISAAFFIVFAYRQGLNDGTKRSEGRELAPLLPKKAKKNVGKTKEDEYEAFLKKEREGANSL